MTDPTLDRGTADPAANATADKTGDSTAPADSTANATVDQTADSTANATADQMVDATATATATADLTVDPTAHATTSPVGASDPIESWPIGRLLSTAARLVEHAWQEALEQRDLTHAGLIALHLLDAGELDQTDLAHRARVEAQTMSRTVDRLERAGFVERTSHPADRRRRYVARTEAGDRALEATRALEAEVFPAVGNPELVRYSLLEIIHAASRYRWGVAARD